MDSPGRDWSGEFKDIVASPYNYTIDELVRLEILTRELPAKVTLEDVHRAHNSVYDWDVPEWEDLP